MHFAKVLAASSMAIAAALPQYPKQYLVDPTALNITELQQVVQVVLETLNMTSNSDNVTVSMTNSTMSNAIYPISFSNITNSSVPLPNSSNSTTAVNVTDLSPAQQLIINSQLTGKYPGKTNNGAGTVQVSPLTMLQTHPGQYQQLYGAGALVDAMQP